MNFSVIISKLVNAMLLKSFNFLFMNEHLINRVESLHHYKNRPVDEIWKNSKIHTMVTFDIPWVCVTVVLREKIKPSKLVH